MGIGISDGTNYADMGEWVAHTTTATPLPEGIKKVYITGTNTEETGSSTTSGMPLGSPTEPAGEFKSPEATQVPGNAEKAKYDTPLTSEEEVKFQEWKQQNAPRDSGFDYDLRGAFKAGVQPDAETGHWPDTYKKPNHPTFSDQSQYAKDRPDLAGRWDGETYYPPAYGLNPPGKDFHETVGNLLFGEGENDIRPALGHIYESAKKAFKLPGDVYGGKIDPTSKQGIERAFDLAGFMVMGPAPIAAKMADGTLGSFAGVKAATTKGKLADLGHAQVLESNAAHPDEILKKTGFFRGTDGRWRHEIDDSKSSFDRKWYVDNSPAKPVWSKVAKENVSKPLSEVLDHPELYKAYPELKNMNVKYDPNDTGAAFSGLQKGITVGKDVVENQGVLMHEVQHAIQTIEGFSKGGSPGQAGKDYTLKLATEARKKIYEPLLNIKNIEERWGLTDATKAEKDKLMALADKYLKYVHAGDTEAFHNYQRLAGEVEARNVDTRLLMTEKDRRQLHPRWTEDYSPDKQIVMEHPITTDPYLHFLNEMNDFKIPSSPKSVSDFRRAANENFPEGHPDRPYNVREPGMIGSKEADDAMEKTWAAVTKEVQRQFELENKLRDQRMALIDAEAAKGKDAWKDELQLARFNKIGKQLSDLMGDPFEPLKFD